MCLTRSKPIQGGLRKISEKKVSILNFFLDNEDRNNKLLVTRQRKGPYFKVHLQVIPWAP